MTQMMTDSTYRERLLTTGLQWSAPDPGWLQAQRTEARRQWERLGLPTHADEQWRFTDLSPLVDTAFSAAPSGTAMAGATVPAFHLDGLEASELVFVNGQLDASASRLPPAPVRVVFLAEAKGAELEAFEPLLGAQASATHHGLIALNAANFCDVVLVEVPAAVVIEQPLHILFRCAGTQPFATHPRILLKIGTNSKVTVVVTFVGSNDLTYLTNAVVETYVGAGSRVELVKIQREGSSALHIGSDYAHLENDVTLQCLTLNMGGLLVRNNVTVTLAGPGSEATLNGLSLTAGRQHVDNHTMLDHAREHCTSHEMYKSLLTGQSSGAFTGKILVRSGSQKTDAKQTSKAVLLSGQATMNSQPQL